MQQRSLCFISNRNTIVRCGRCRDSLRLRSPNSIDNRQLLYSLYRTRLYYSRCPLEPRSLDVVCEYISAIIRNDCNYVFNVRWIQQGLLDWLLSEGISILTTSVHRVLLCLVLIYLYHDVKVRVHGVTL